MRIQLILIIIFLSTILYGQTPDLGVLIKWDSLINLSREYTSKENFVKALEYNDLAENQVISKFGNDSPEYATICFNRGRIYYFKENYEEAELWYLKSLELREKHLGKEHIDYALSLHNLGGLYTALYQLDKGLQFYLQSADIRKKVLGTENPTYAQSLHNIAGIYFDISEYSLAEKYYIETIDIRYRILGESHPDYIYSLSNLATLYVEMAYYDKAEPIYLRISKIQEKVYGREHHKYATALHDLGILYDEMGNYNVAKKYYMDALLIRQKVLGKDDPSYAWSLNDFGTLYLNLGEYEKAELMFQESKDIRERVLGKSHPDYSNSLNNLGVLYFQLANYQKAEEYLKEAIGIRESSVGQEQFKYAISLVNLGKLYDKIGKDELAEKYLLQAKDVFSTSVGVKHPYYAMNLVNIAKIYDDKQNLIKAKTMLIEAESTLSVNPGKETVNYAKCIHRLAEISYKLGSMEEALNYFDLAKDLLTTLGGPQHPYYVQFLKSLCRYNMLVGDLHKAEELWYQINEGNQNNIKKALHHLSEKELYSYILEITQVQDELISYAVKTKSKRLIEIAYNGNLFYKNLLLYTTREIKEFLAKDSVSKSNFQIYVALRKRLAKEYAKPKFDRLQLKEMEERVNYIEKTLVNSCKEFDLSDWKMDWQSVCSKLEMNEVAIEFVEYRNMNQFGQDSSFFAAFILLPMAESPILLQLCPTSLVDALINSDGRSFSSFINKIYSESSSVLTSSLYQLIWKPLESYLIEKKRIYCTVSGSLHQLNLAALSTTNVKNKILGDQFEIILMTSASQIGRKTDEYSNHGNVAIFGDIHYDVDSTVLFADHISLNTISEGKNQVFDNPEFLELSREMMSSRGMYEGEWPELKFSAKEIDEIYDVFLNRDYKPILLRGNQANEEGLAALELLKPTPKIIHLSTHGYFFSNPKDLKIDIRTRVNEIPYSKVEDPMLRSGIVLAGANYAWREGKSFGNNEDGIVTASEIALLNLSNTDLVVLSACETGLGDVTCFEGVYGLQRAFKMAGVKNILMSLWEVDDEATSILMVEFYKQYLIRGKSYRNALHSAQKLLRSQKKFSNPYYWAGFILLE